MVILIMIDKKILNYIEEKADNGFNIIRNKDVIQGLERKGCYPGTNFLSGFTRFFFKSIKLLDDKFTVEIVSDYKEFEVTLGNEQSLKHTGEKIVLSNYNDIISNFLIAKPSKN